MEKIIELLARLEFSSYSDVIKRIVESKGNRIFIGGNFYLKFDFEYIGFIVSEGYENGGPSHLVCPVKGCLQYTAAGHVCPDHCVEAEMRSLIEKLPFFAPLKEKLELIHVETMDCEINAQGSNLLFKGGIITSKGIERLFEALSKNGGFPNVTVAGAEDDSEDNDKEYEFLSEELGVHVLRSPAYNRSLKVTSLDGLLCFHTCAQSVCRKIGVKRSAVEHFCLAHHGAEPKSSRKQTLLEMRMAVSSAWKKANPGVNLEEYKECGTFWLNMLRLIRDKGKSGFTRIFHQSGGVITLFLSHHMQFNYKSRTGGRRMYICGQPFCFRASVSKIVGSDWRQYMCKLHADTKLQIVDIRLDQ